MKFNRILAPLALSLLLASCGVSGNPDDANSSGADIISSTSTVPSSITGSGTKDDPYVIWTADQLADFASTYNKQSAAPTAGSYYKLGADIDLSGVDISPIGTSSVPFVGHFDGDGHAISNLTFSKYNKNVTMYGLFGYTSSSQIHDVNVNIDFEFTPLGSKSYVYVGGLVAGAYNTDIYNVSVSGDIDITSGQNSSSQLIVGGIVGLGQADSNYYIELTHCSSYVNINCDMSSADSTTNVAAGIAGALSTSSAKGVYALSTCYYEGSVFAEDVAGGILGISSYYTSVVDCYATGTKIEASADDGAYAGGIVGQAYYEMAVLHNYADFASVVAENTGTSSVYKSYAGSIVGLSFSDLYDSDSDIFGTVAYSNYASVDEIKSQGKGIDGDKVAADSTIKDSVGLSSYWTIDGNDAELEDLTSYGTVNVILNSNYDGGSSQNQTLTFDKGTYSSESVSTAISKEFTRDHYSYSGLYYDTDATQPYCFFAPFTVDSTLYAGYGDLSKLVGTYDYVCCRSGSTTVTASGTWYFDEENFYWQNKYYETFKYTYHFDGNYIFIDDGDGSYTDEIFAYNEDGTITAYDLTDGDYVYTATKSATSFTIPDYSNTSYLGTWYFSNDAIVTLTENGNASGITKTSKTAYYGGFNEADGNVEIYIPGRIHATVKYDATNNIFYSSEYFGAASSIDKIYSTADKTLYIYVVGEKTYAIFGGVLVSYTGSLTDGGSITIGDNTYTVSGTTLAYKDPNKGDDIPDSIVGTFTDSDDNELVLTTSGSGTWNGISFTWKYDSSSKTGTISSFDKYDGTNTITFNDDGSVTITISDSSGANSYTSTLGKKVAPVVAGYVGTWKCKTSGNTVTMVLNEDGTGTYNGIAFTYTVEGNTITFSVGGMDVTLTYNETSGTMSGSFDQGGDIYSYTSITKVS